MPTVYYTYYTPKSESISEISHQEHLLGQKLLAYGLNELYGIALSLEELEASLARDTFDKPYLAHYPEIFFNITHCDGLVACGFCDSPIGVDAELTGYYPPILYDRALTEGEKDFLLSHCDTPSQKEEWFYRLWTLKEAYVKKSGVGVDADLKEFSFSFTIKQEEDIHILCSNPSAICHQVKLEKGHILSLCYEDYSSNSKNNVVYLPMS